MKRASRRRADWGAISCGFTLVEVVTIALILGILAAAVVPKLLNNRHEAMLNATMHDVHAIDEAAYRFRTINGRWPEFTYKWNAPGDFEGYINSSVFKKEPPIGSTDSFGWIWHRDVLGVEALILLYHPDRPLKLWQELDDRFDDGNLATGSIYIYANQFLFFIVEDT